MKKQILNVGKALNKAEQKKVNGGGKGRPTCCNPTFYCCNPNPNYNGSNCQFIYAPVPGMCCV